MPATISTCSSSGCQTSRLSASTGGCWPTPGPRPNLTRSSTPSNNMHPLQLAINKILPLLIPILQAPEAGPVPDCDEKVWGQGEEGSQQRGPGLQSSLQQGLEKCHNQGGHVGEYNDISTLPSQTCDECDEEFCHGSCRLFEYEHHQVTRYRYRV